MFLKPAEWIKKTDNLSIPHKGLVIYNKDPQQLGRLKVDIPLLFCWQRSEGASTEEKIANLPWVYPMFPVELGSAPLTSGLYVPETNTEIMITFPYESIYFPFYSYTTLSENNRVQSMCSSYPDRYGKSDSLENKMIVDKNAEVNTTERRYADGSVSVHDCRFNLTEFRDLFGTSVFIDRANQEAIIEFAGHKVFITKDGISLDIKTLTGLPNKESLNNFL